MRFAIHEWPTKEVVECIQVFGESALVSLDGQYLVQYVDGESQDHPIGMRRRRWSNACWRQSHIFGGRIVLVVLVDGDIAQE